MNALKYKLITTRLAAAIHTARVMMNKPAHYVALSIMIFTEQAAVGQEMVFPNEDWIWTAPETLHVDSSRLNKAAGYLDANIPGQTGTDELVIIRNGRMIWEGSNAERSHEVYSVTKSMTTTVLGLVIDDGLVALDTRAADYFPALAEKYSDLTLRHLANQTSPYRAIGETTSTPFPNTLWSPDEPRFQPAGAESCYSHVTSEMLSRVLTRVTGEPMDDVFRRRIADPIGMKSWSWLDWSGTPFGTPDGIALNRGSHGIQMSSLDAARFGHLFLNEGRWHDEQIVSQEWVRAATSVQVDASLAVDPSSRVISIFGNSSGPGVYGYGWWVNGTNPEGQRFFPGATPETYLAYGIDNNVIVVVPEWDMVVVRQASNEASVPNSIWATFLSLVGDAVMDVPRGGSAPLPYQEIRLPYAIGRSRDTDFDGSGNTVDNVLSVSTTSVGENDQLNGNWLSRLVAKFDLPDLSNFAPGVQFEQGKLRFYLNSVSGTPAEPVSVFHSVADNDTNSSASDHEDPSYTDTQLDLVQPTDIAGKYYEIDVTDFIQSDYDADGDTPISAFRLQMTNAEFFEDNQSNLYNFAITGNQLNYPELVLSFDLMGNLNDDGVLDIGDIDLLLAGVREGKVCPDCDLNDDGNVTDQDVSFWVHDLKQTWFGDANLDGEFKSGDLVQVLAAGTYETDVLAGWSTGDFDGSGRFDSGDLIDALADGGYEQGLRPATPAVPEPSGIALVTITAIALSQARSKSRSAG